MTDPKVAGEALVKQGMSIRAAAKQCGISGSVLTCYLRRNDPCLAPGCPSAGKYARGLCNTHNQQRLRGEPFSLSSRRMLAMTDSDLVDEYRFMRDYCGLSVPRTLLAIKCTAKTVVGAFRRLDLEPPEELGPVMRKTFQGLEDCCDERFQVAG